jgi:hypothetical protein
MMAEQWAAYNGRFHASGGEVLICKGSAIIPPPSQSRPNVICHFGGQRSALITNELKKKEK